MTVYYSLLGHRDLVEGSLQSLLFIILKFPSQEQFTPLGTGSERPVEQEGFKREFTVPVTARAEAASHHLISLLGSNALEKPVLVQVSQGSRKGPKGSVVVFGVVPERKQAPLPQRRLPHQKY